MTGHTSGDRMNGIGHFNAFCLQHIRHFPKRMLGLGNGHAVTRNNNHLRCIFHKERGIFRGTGFDRALFSARTTNSGSAAFRTESAQQDVKDRPVHALAHDVTKNRP